MHPIIETPRLILRAWKKEDAEAYFQINQDPKVIEFLPSSMTMEEVALFMERENQNFLKKRFCLFATEVKVSKEMIGFIGLSNPSFQAHFTPCVEIGWRLGSQYWGQGYATEGARAVLHYAFETLGLNEVVSFTTLENKRSKAVMDRIGMQRDREGDFAHPRLASEHPLSAHLLYRIQTPFQKK